VLQILRAKKEFSLFDSLLRLKEKENCFFRKFYRVNGELVEFEKIKWKWDKENGLFPVFPDLILVCRNVKSKYGAEGTETIMEIEIEKERIDPTPEESLALYDLIKNL
jgi:hypothetical protein